MSSNSLSELKSSPIDVKTLPKRAGGTHPSFESRHPRFAAVYVSGKRDKLDALV